MNKLFAFTITTCTSIMKYRVDFRISFIATFSVIVWLNHGYLQVMEDK